MYNQKEIVLVPFPYSDLTGIKQRPALILSNERINRTQDVICCLITSNPSKNGILIKNNSLEEGNLPFKSWVKPHRIFTIHTSVIKKRLCTITDEFHDGIVMAINGYLKRG